MFLGHNKEVVQEYKEALQAVYALSDELNKQKEALEQQESDEKGSNVPLVTMGEWSEDTLQ